MAVIPGNAGKIPEAMAMENIPNPELYQNTLPQIAGRRVLQMDNGTATTAQFMKDRGQYIRRPVGTVEYTEGNIKKSNQVTGLPGYQHPDGVPLPLSPDDMSQQAYVKSMLEATPVNRLALQKTVGENLRQNFLSGSSAQLPQQLISPMLEMQNSLLNQANMKNKARKK